MSLLGERLRRAREAHGFAPLQIEMDTRIRATVIQALEQGDYENLPPEPFLRGLIRTYSAYLDLDSEEMLELYRADRMPPPLRPARPGPTAKPSVTRPEALAPIPKPTDAPIPSAESAGSLPPAEPIRKPAAIRLPSLRPPIPRPPAPKPSLPVPPMPPESLARSESPTPTTATDGSPVEPTARAHFTRRPMPLPVILTFIGGIVCVCLISGLIVLTQFSPMMFQLVGLATGTPTRVPPTRTPTLRPGTIPTAIPTIAATAPPSPAFPGNPTSALKATPRPTPETYSGLNLDVIEVTQTITLRVGVDGVLVFSGQMQPSTTRSWSAKDSLYVQIENPKGATFELNGNAKWFAPRNFAETKTLERQWTLNDRGTPIPATPVAPAAPPATTPILVPPTMPTPTLTPFS